MARTQTSCGCVLDFDWFWADYPKKVGKLEAARVWAKLRPNLALVATALEWQTQSAQWRSGYVPNPATYLRQGRWLDENDTVPARATGCSRCGAPELCRDVKACNARWLAQERAKVSA